MENSKIPLKIVAKDIVGDCVRLNRRFDLAEGRIASAETGIAAGIEKDVSLSAEITTLKDQVTALEGPESGTRPIPLSAPATSILTVNTGFQAVPGMTFILTKKGWWKFDVTVRWIGFTLDFASAFYVVVDVDSVILPGALLTVIEINGYSIDHRSWLFKSITGGETISVMAKKTGGTGTSAVNGNATPSLQTSQIIGVWVGP